MEKTGNISQKALANRVYLAPLEGGCEILSLCHKNALQLRERGIRPEMLPGETSLSKHLKKANQLGIRFVAIMGSAEFEKKKWTLKDMEAKTQSEIAADDLASHLSTLIQYPLCHSRML